jgi:hypothetical protein
MQTNRWLDFDRLGLPGRRSRLHRGVRDQLSFSIGRRWSRRLTFRSFRVPEMLHPAIFRERGCKICRVFINGP